MITAISMVDASYSYGETLVIQGVRLEVLQGEVFGLIGKSGSGKSTLLRLISGLVKPSSGTVSTFGAHASGWSGRERHVATVWQSRALFPHLTVRENLGFGLWAKGISSSEREGRVKQFAERFGLTKLLDRAPITLSGGEQQRVAVVRAMLARPRILLLDEPFTGLDNKLKLQVQAELREIVNSFECTYVIVSHAHEEVFALASRTAVLDRGAICQIGAGDELYRSPANLFVAEFVGGRNILGGTLRALGDGTFGLMVAQEEKIWGGRLCGTAADGSIAWYAIAPSDISVGTEGSCRSWGSVRAIERFGLSTAIFVRLNGGAELKLECSNAAFPPDRGITIGEKIPLSWRCEDGLIFCQ